MGGTFSGIDDFVGNGANSTFTGLTAATTYNISGTNDFTFGTPLITVTDFANLTAGANADSFNFQSSGSFSGILDGGAGANTINYNAENFGASASVDFQNHNGSGFSGGGTFSNIQNFIGRGTGYTFIGPDSATTFNITGQNDFNFAGNNVTDFANLTGGSVNDVFSFGAGSSLTGILNGGGGSVNELRYSSFGSNVSVNFQASTATAISGGFQQIQNFTGSALSGDSFRGLNAGTNYSITALNAFNTTSFTASSFENLFGGSGADTFNVDPGAGLTGQLDGEGGLNTLDYSGYGSAVTVNLGSGSATGFGGYSDIGDFVGSSETDTLFATGGPDIIEITADKAGTVNGSTTFSEFEILDAGAGNDRFNFRNQATVDLVNGGADTNGDTLFLDDSTLPGPGVEHTYTITSNSITRNPTYNFTNIEAIQLLGGSGDDTINSNFFPEFSQSLDAGLGFNTLNLPGVTNLDGRDVIGNVTHFRFAAPRNLPIPDGGTPPPPSTFVAETRFNANGISAIMEQLLGGGTGFSASPVTGQGIIVAVDNNSYMIFRAISMDGSGLTPSDVAVAALSNSLSVEANVELAGAIGFTGIVTLFQPDGAYSLDLTGALPSPATALILQQTLSIQAALELYSALGIPFSMIFSTEEGAFAIDFNDAAPGQSIIVVLIEQLSDAAFAELSAALAGEN